MRKRMMWFAFVLLVTLAGIEAALALMRDMLIADKPALLQSLPTARGTSERRRAGAHPDPRPDAARLHPAVRARLHRDSARVVHRLGPDRGRCRAGDARARAAFALRLVGTGAKLARV